MIGYKQCQACRAVNPPDASYCACGQALSDRDLVIPPAEGQAVVETFNDQDFAVRSPYALLTAAVVILRVLAVLFALLAVVQLLTKDLTIVPLLAGLAGTALKTFLIWITADVIKLLLDIRQGQLAQ